MKKSRKATSIVEVMIVILVIVSGVVGMYKVFGESMDLSLATNNKIQAIQIAREGIEAVKNIRDTNIILYGADIDNCWNVKDYNLACVGDTSSNTDDYDITAGTYYIEVDSTNRWLLKADSGTKTKVRILNSNGFYYQGSAPTTVTTNTSPLFTRQIIISYPDVGSNTDRLKITSFVEWVEKNKKRNVTFSTVLTNWKD